MKNNCWIRAVNVQEELELFFADLDRELSSYYEVNPNDREEHLESQLATLLRTKPFRLHEDRIAKERARLSQPPLQLKIAVRHITNIEAKYGADIGLVAELNCPGEYQLRKATLIQSKRLSPINNSFNENCSYSEIFRKTDEMGKSKSQWERMLNVTPSSVYFLYNPERLYIKRRVHNLGTRVVSARLIAGTAEAGQSKFTATDAYDQGSTFSSWMVDEFVCCNAGDTRDEVVRIALGESQDFPVRHSFVFTISRAETNQPSDYFKLH